MLEIVAAILLAIFTVLMADAGAGKAKKKSGLEKNIESISVAADKIEKHPAVRGYRTASAFLGGVYRELTQETGGNIFDKMARVLGLTYSAYHGEYVSKFRDRIYDLEHSEEGRTWTSRYLSMKEAKDIYRDLLIDKNAPSIEEVYGLRKGSEYVRALTRLSGGEIEKVLVEAGLDRGAKKHAHHHEAIHAQHPDWSEGQVEREVLEHYARNQWAHLEELSAVNRYYSELKKNRPEIFREIEKQFVGG